MYTVQDCIQEMNQNKDSSKNNIFKLKQKTNENAKEKNSFFSNIINLIISISTIIKYETFFYETQSKQAKSIKNVISKELKEIIIPHRLITRDFAKISVWEINPHKSNKYVIFCEGLSSEKGELQFQKLYKSIIASGYGIIAFDYRDRFDEHQSFSQNGAFIDTLTVYEYLKRKNIKPYNIGIIGHSLGSAVACHFASKKLVAFSILINPFSKASDMVKKILEELNIPSTCKSIIKKLSSSLYPLKNSFDNEKTISSINSPILIIHNLNDKSIPVEQGRKLFNKNRNKENIFYKELDNDEHEINEEKIDICTNFINKYFKNN